MSNRAKRVRAVSMRKPCESGTMLYAERGGIALPRPAPVRGPGFDPTRGSHRVSAQMPLVPRCLADSRDGCRFLYGRRGVGAWGARGLLGCSRGGRRNAGPSAAGVVRSRSRSLPRGRPRCWRHRHQGQSPSQTPKAPAMECSLRPRGLEWVIRQIQLKLTHRFGRSSWGWAVIATTCLLNGLLLPFRIFAARNAQAMRRLQPKIEAVNAKYKAKKSSPLQVDADHSAELSGSTATRTSILSAVAFLPSPRSWSSAGSIR